jgi:hypothetical protein
MQTVRIPLNDARRVLLAHDFCNGRTVVKARKTIVDGVKDVNLCGLGAATRWLPVIGLLGNPNSLQHIFDYRRVEAFVS